MPAEQGNLDSTSLTSECPKQFAGWYEQVEMCYGRPKMQRLDWKISFCNRNLYFPIIDTFFCIHTSNLKIFEVNTHVAYEMKILSKRFSSKRFSSKSALHRYMHVELVRKSISVFITFLQRIYIRVAIELIFCCCCKVILRRTKLKQRLCMNKL